MHHILEFVHRRHGDSLQMLLDSFLRYVRWGLSLAVHALAKELKTIFGFLRISDGDWLIHGICVGICDQ